MSQIAKSHLLSGIIFGDAETNEYVYLPGGEVGATSPICIFEHDKKKDDISLEQAAYLIEHLTLKPCIHPVLGKHSF